MRRLGDVNKLDPGTWGGSPAALVLIDKLKKQDVPIFVVNKIGSTFHFLNRHLNILVLIPPFHKERLFFVDRLYEQVRMKFQAVALQHPEFTDELLRYALNVASAHCRTVKSDVRRSKKNET